MFWVYMLRCADGTYYTGHTDDLERRLKEHQSGHLETCYTFRRRPVDLVWSETFETRIEALEAERMIKGWSKAKKEALIRGDWDAVQRLARRRKSFETVARPQASLPPQDERIWKEPQIQNHSVRAEEALKPQAEGPSRSTPAQAETPTQNPPPIIVLVRPQLGENIGKAARAMLNFGLTDLRLVAPRDGWPNPDAGPAAAGADIVLNNAQVFDSVADAVADCAHVFATTVRKRGVVKPVVDAEQAATTMRAEPGRSAILFGPERAGLETDDVALARTILTVPINPEFGSLNLAQAVILVAYEWSKGVTLTQPTVSPLAPPADQSDLDGLFDHFDRIATATGFYFPKNKVPTLKRTIRGILTKPAWNAQEVRTLRGVLTMIERPKPKD